MQLHAFLSSWARHVASADVVNVLFKATGDRHARAYYDLAASTGPGVQFYGQRDFKKDFEGMLPDRGPVIFFVDDQIFVRDWNAEARPGLSLRLGRNLTRCYPTNSAQPLPKFRSAGGGLLRWTWGDGHGDWGYPLSLDGHVLDSGELKSMLVQLDYASPNQLEASLQRYASSFAAREGFCYQLPKIVNVPWNRVQDEFPNRAGVGHDAEWMLALWEDGLQIDVAALDDVETESAHQELPIAFERRPFSKRRAS